METFISLLTHPHVLKILILSASGLLIRQALVFTGQRWANTYHHLGSYILLPNISLIITSIIKDDIALSLGMIGALSIVRFRNPVKSPFELVMFFALLTLGITTSVSILLGILLALLVITVILAIKFVEQVFKKFNLNIFQYSFGDGNLNYTVEINSATELSKELSNENIINFYFDKENSNYTYRIVFNSKEELIKFTQKAQKMDSVLNVRADINS